MKQDRKEWERFMNRPPKKEKKVKSVLEETPIEKVLINGDEELFAELCAAEETIKKLKEEVRSVKEHYANKEKSRLGSYSLSFPDYAAAVDTDTFYTHAQQQMQLERTEAIQRRQQQVQQERQQAATYYGQQGTYGFTTPTVDPAWAAANLDTLFTTTGTTTPRRGTTG